MAILVERDEGESQRLREVALALKVDAKELAKAPFNHGPQSSAPAQAPKRQFPCSEIVPTTT
jgi:hypothetical protein